MILQPGHDAQEKAKDWKGKNEKNEKKNAQEKARIERKNKK